MKKIKIIQFTPYYYPHVGGVEKVVQEIHENWKHRKSIIFTSDIGRGITREQDDLIYYPAFELVQNFPFPKIWKKDFWHALSQLQKHVGSDTRVITHTRFFLSSFIGMLFAKKHKLRSIHIEHGSDLVDTPNFLVRIGSRIYDYSFGKLTLKGVDKVLAISASSAEFLEKSFHIHGVQIWYRGIEPIKSKEKKKKTLKIVYIGRLVALKQVDDLIQAMKKGGIHEKCVIIGDGQERKRLEFSAEGSDIEFLGTYTHSQVIDFLQKNKCILVNTSSQEGLPTTVIEGLMTNNVVIATDVGGTGEISKKEDLVLYESGDIFALKSYLKQVIKQYDDLQGKSYSSVIKKFSMKDNIENLYNHIN